MSRLLASVLLSLGVVPSASAVTMDWTPIGSPGNAPDSSSYQSCGLYGNEPCGAVAYGYQIGTYDVTNAQYAEFLNAKAQSDPLGLYQANMADPLSFGGIARSGNAGSYSYAAIAGRENLPVNFVSFYDALRFANWMNNGQGTGDTETGAYTLLGGTATPSNDDVVRNAGANIVLPTENEWYKAAYYDPATSSYFDYPAGSNAPTTCSAPTAAANHANCDQAVYDLTPVGSYTASASPYGTFDQGGNVYQWAESMYLDGSIRMLRGGDFYGAGDHLAASMGGLTLDAVTEHAIFGFRVAMIPEPGTSLLVSAGVLGLAAWRRVRD